MRLHVLIPVLAAGLLTLAGCMKEQERETPPVVQMMTIRVSMPDEAATKAAFSIPGEGSGLHLAWQAGDQIRVIGGAGSAVYDIQPGFTDHVAEFAGPAIEGDYFDIIAPGSYASVEAAEAGDASLTQTGNGSTDHLVFTAKLGHVAKADLADIGFTDDWVAAHAGTTLKRGGIVKLALTLPAALTAPQRVMLRGIGEEIGVNITGVDLTSEHVLTAYAQSGWDDIEILAGSTFSIDVQDSEYNCYTVTKTIPSAVTFKAGKQNSFKITDGFAKQLFAGGDGSEGSPYLLATAEQLDNLHADGVLISGEKVYFRLIRDIDMETYLSSNVWVPLNKDNPYDLAVNIDGNHHIIDHFSITTNTTNQNPQTGFFGVLYGEVYDLTFTNASVINTYGKATGILCGFCGYSGKMSHVYNVHVNGSISYTGDKSLSGANLNGPVGGMVGRIHTCLIESCSAFDMNIRSNRAYSGGLFGYDVAAGSTVLNCWTSGIIGGDSSHGGNLGGQRIGGICGGLISQHTAIVNCFSTMSILNTYAMGGIAGHCNLDKANANPSNVNHPTKTSPLNTIQGCIAWNDEITSHATDPDNDHYSSGAIVGYTATHNYLSNCLRKSDLSFTDYTDWEPYDQEDSSPDVPLVVNSYDGKNYHFPYHGKAFAGTLSAAAASLGWDTEVWDLSGSVPVLTGAIQTGTVTSGASAVPAGSAGSGPQYPSAGDGWTVTTVRDGIKYYEYDNADFYSSGAASARSFDKYRQNVFVVDVDLNNPAYKVQLVYASPTAACSQVFDATKAIAAINAGYERSSIAVKANVKYEWTKMDDALENNELDNVNTEELIPYPLGLGVSYMPNNTITDTGVPNWKSQGTVYFDGVRGVRLAFDGYDPAKAPGGSGNPPVKSVQEERLFYQLNTNNEPGLLSSAPVLIENYNKVGTSFTTWYPKQAEEPSEAPYSHQNTLAPRTAVALNADNHLLLVVVDGRYAKGVGGQGMGSASLSRFLSYFFNAQYALNLDGGGSATMCVEGQGDGSTHVVNYPVDNRLVAGHEHDHQGQRARDTFIVIVPAE